MAKVIYKGKEYELGSSSKIKSEVATAIAELVANAPENLDTLKEIADYLENHDNSVAEINTKLNSLSQSVTSILNGGAPSHIDILDADPTNPKPGYMWITKA